MAPFKMTNAAFASDGRAREKGEEKQIVVKRGEERSKVLAEERAPKPG